MYDKFSFSKCVTFPTCPISEEFLLLTPFLLFIPVYLFLLLTPIIDIYFAYGTLIQTVVTSLNWSDRNPQTMKTTTIFQRLVLLLQTKIKIFYAV